VPNKWEGTQPSPILEQNIQNAQNFGVPEKSLSPFIALFLEIKQTKNFS